MPPTGAHSPPPAGSWASSAIRVDLHAPTSRSDVTTARLPRLSLAPFWGPAVSPNSLPVSDVPVLVWDSPLRVSASLALRACLLHHASRSSCRFWRHFHDNSHVQLLSIQLFCKVMELVVEEGEELLMTFVNQSLLPLFLRWHDKNLHVAKASFLALLCAARFLRRRDLEELLMKARRIKFAESLLLQDESRAAKSPQRTLREAALRFMALQTLKEDESPSCLSKLLQLIFEGRSAGLCLMDQMYRRPSAISSAH
ncbi:uncharacterized protein LOC141726586 isoform X2 [Zonotrichia albicollis]|uniref:uncharacterized protein LOC141726586 isoform X2 n=1 Tax=Zonotrichia albicollis TaxID=44394 RepID=UPI003D80FCA0